MHCHKHQGTFETGSNTGQCRQNEVGPGTFGLTEKAGKEDLVPRIAQLCQRYEVQSYQMPCKES